ncbi:hypothetical protein [Pyrococcus kukulkanii]
MYDKPFVGPLRKMGHVTVKEFKQSLGDNSQGVVEDGS